MLSWLFFLSSSSVSILSLQGFPALVALSCSNASPESSLRLSAVVPGCHQGPGRTAPHALGQEGRGFWSCPLQPGPSRDGQPLLGQDRAPRPGRAAAAVELVHVRDGSPGGRGTVCFKMKITAHLPWDEERVSLQLPCRADTGLCWLDSSQS